MKMLKCTSCGGVYPADNYYHACPPEIGVDIIETATGIPLVGDPDPKKKYSGKVVTTPFSRDENVDDSGKQKKGKARDKGGAIEV